MVARGDLVLLSGASSAEEMKLGKELSEKAVQLWDGWELRVMVCLSLVLQIILIMLGSRRTYTARRWITFIVWSSFLVADMVATTALGILARSQGKSGNDKNYSIQAFWAPFLLLHLGGPDKIIAYSIQDRELWLRHLLGLVIQVAIVFYVFLKAWNATTTTLTFLTIPMLVYGIMKYGEKTLSLSLPPYNRFNDIDGLVIRCIYSEKKPLHQAYNLFWYSMVQFYHLYYPYGIGEKDDVLFNLYISGKSAEYVFELVEMELGLFYDVFYTKAPTMYSILGVPFRLVSLVCCITTLVSFFILVDKKPYSRPDVGITYLLLWGAFVLEVYAFTCLVFSDWIMLLHFAESREGPTNSVYALHKNFTKGRRWCGSIAQLSFICHYSNKISPKFLEKMMKSMYTADRKVVEPELKKMIFDQLLQNGKKLLAVQSFSEWQADELRGMLTAQRGEGVLERMKDHPVYVECKRVVESEFNQSLFIWHIVTDLCYYDDLHRDAENLSLECKVSKWLSDYMMYLMVMRPSMLPKVTDYYLKTSFKVACRWMKRFTGKMEGISVNEMNAWIVKLEELEFAFRPLGKDPLVVGCKLAKKLKELDDAKRNWEMISKIWIEMLGYAAIRCEWREHLEGLGRGGELLTHVCFLMKHLGLKLPSEIGKVPV